MSWKDYLLIFSLFSIVSCKAQLKQNGISLQDSNIDLSFINNDSISYTVTKVACDTCFPVIDVGYRVVVDCSPIEKQKLKNISKQMWLNMLNDPDKDYAANIWLYYFYEREAIVLFYHQKKSKWRKVMKEDDILFWRNNLK
jgi:hypothetical protein